MRKTLIGICSFTAMMLTTLNAAAQDKIYLVDGAVVEAKVKEVGPKNIVYTRWDNKEGAEYVVVRRDVDKIVFENGSEERISRSARRAPEPRKNNEERLRTPVPGYGKNILAFAPIQMTNESPAGIGIQYEHMMDKSGIFSLYLPIAISFYEDSYYLNSQTAPKKSRVFTYLYPGVKIYPAGSAHRVAYSIGPSVALGFGEKYKSVDRIDPGTGSVIRKIEEGSVFKTGFMINNGLNIQPTKSLYLGLELGVGIQYYNNEDVNDTFNNDPLVQFNFKMGYRF